MKLALRTGALLAGATVLLGCATGGSKMGTADAIKARQDLMKEQGAALRAMNEKVKGGQAQAIGPEAEKLARTARQIAPLFPQGSLDPNTSRAKPEIWQKWSEFEGYAKTLETKASQLASSSKTASADATAAAVADLGRTTCGACHNAFRGPEIKK